MQYLSMTLLLIIIWTSLRFALAFPVLYRSLKHTGHAETYGVSIIPTYFTSKFTTVFAVENDETNLYENNDKRSCVNCQNSSVVPEETVMEQEAGSLRHSGYTISRQDKLNSSTIKTSIEKIDLNTIPMNTIFSSSQNDDYIHIPPSGTEQSSMIQGESFSAPYYSVEQERENFDIYSALQDTVSGYTSSFAVGYSSTGEYETLEEKTAVIQLEDPTTIDQTTEHPYQSVPSMNVEHSLGIESITSGHIPKPTYSKGTELHTNVKIVSQHTPTTNYTTGSTAGEIERNSYGLITSILGITGLKHETSSQPQLAQQGIQTTTLESFSFKNSWNEISNKSFKTTTEYEEKTSVTSHEDNIKATYSKKNENIIGTTQQVEYNDSLMLPSIITTAAQLDSNVVTVNTEKYERTHSTAEAEKEQAHIPSSTEKYVKQSHTWVLDTSFETSTVPAKEGNSREYNKPSTVTSRNVMRTVEQNCRKTENIGPSSFSSVDRDQLKDVEYLETTEVENDLDIVTLEISSTGNDNSEERVAVGMSKDNARIPTSQGPQVTGGQNNYTNLSYEYDNRTSINLQQRFTSESSLRQSNQDLEIKERWKNPAHSGEYYPDEKKKPEGTESLPTAPFVHTTGEQQLISLNTNQRAREELHNDTQAPKAQEEDIENFEIIEGYEKLNLAITTISPISRSREWNGKIGNATMAQRRMESMRIAPNRHDELDRPEFGDRRHNSTMELKRKEKPQKHFKTEKLEEKSKLGNLNSKFWSKGGGVNNKGEKSTKTSDSGAVTSSTFVKVMKIKKQKSTVASGQREEKNNTNNKEKLKLHSRITQINGNGLVSNFTKIMKHKKQKYNTSNEEQRKMYHKKNVKNNEFQGTVSNFTKIMKVKTMKNALIEKSEEEPPLSESVRRLKIDRKRLQEQKSVTMFIKTLKVRKPKEILTITGRDDVNKSVSMSKLKLSKQLNQRRQFSAATVSNFTKKLRGKKQKHTFTYSGREEARTTGGPENLESDKKKHISRWECSPNVSGKEQKYEGLEILANKLPILQPNNQKVGKLKEVKVNMEGNGNARQFHFRRKDMKIIAKKENVSTNEKTKEGIRKDALMLSLNQQKSRKEDMTESTKKQSEKNSLHLSRKEDMTDHTKKQSEKNSLHLRNMKMPEPRMDILFSTTKKHKFPRFALDLLKTTVFVKRKKLAKIRQQKKTTLFIPITVPYQKSFFNTQDQYWNRRKESPEKSVDLYFPTIASYQTGFSDNPQRKKMFRYPLKLPVPTLFTVSKAKEYITQDANTDVSRFRKRPKLMKYTKPGVTKPMPMWFTARKGHKLNKETNESISVALTDLTPTLFTNEQNWNRKNQRPEKAKDLFIPSTIPYQSRFTEKQRRKYFTRYPLNFPLPTLFTKSKARDSTDAEANTHQNRFIERPKEMLSATFAVTNPLPMWFTRRKGQKIGLEQPKWTAGVFYPITVPDEPKLLNVPKRTDTSVLVPTIPVPLAFTKRKKPKFKLINTTVSFSPLPIFRQNKFDSFPDVDKPPQTATISYLPRMFTRWQHGELNTPAAKTAAHFTPTTSSYESEFHEVSTQYQKYGPGIVFPLFRKRIGQGRTNEMTTRSRELFHTGTYASERKLQESQTKKRYGQETTNEMTTLLTKLFYPVTNAYQRKQGVTQTKRKQTVVSSLAKSREKNLRRKWPLKTSTPAKYPHETNFDKTPKQDRQTKLPVTKAHWMFRQFPVKIPTINDTTKKLMRKTTSETQDSERPPESTCPETSYGDQELTCPASWSTPTRTTYSTSDGGTDHTESSSSIQTSDTIRTTEWFTLDSIPSDSEPSWSTSTPPVLVRHSEPYSTDETAADTGSTEDKDGPLTSIPGGNGLGTSPITWKAISTFEPINSRTTILEHSSSTLILSALATHDGHPIIEDTTTDANPPSETISSTIEETNISSTTSTMNPSSVPSTEYGTYLLGKTSTLISDSETIQGSTIVTGNIHTDWSSPILSKIAYEYSVSNVPQSITETSTVTSSGSKITQELTALNDDIHTDWSSTTASNIDYEFSLSNVPQFTTEISGLVTRESQITQESTILNEDFHAERSNTTAPSVDTEFSIYNVSNFTSEPSTLILSDAQTNAVSEDIHTDWSSTTTCITDYEYSLSNVPQFTTEPSTLSDSDSQRTQESTASNEDFHTDWSSTTFRYTDYEFSLSKFPQSTTEPSSLTTCEPQKSEESTALNEDFHTDRSSTSGLDIDTELAVSDVYTVYTRTDSLIFGPSINTSPISDSLLSNGISISSLTSPLIPTVTPEITSYAQHEEDTECLDGREHTLVTGGSNTTDSYFDTEVSNTNVPQSVSDEIHVETGDLILPSSINTSPISNLLPSPGDTTSSLQSPHTTALTHDIASATSYGAHSLPLDGVQQGPDSSWPVRIASPSGTKPSTSFESHLVDENVAGTSTTLNPGSLRWAATTRISLSTPALEITKRRTCKRQQKTSPGDAVTCALPVPFLTLRPTLRRRLKSSTPSAA